MVLGRIPPLFSNVCYLNSYSVFLHWCDVHEMYEMATLRFYNIFCVSFAAILVSENYYYYFEKYVHKAHQDRLTI